MVRPRNSASRSPEHLQDSDRTRQLTGPTVPGASARARWERYLIGLIALCWSLFQLSAASFVLLDSLTLRAIHLGFAMLLVFCAFPLRIRKNTHKDGVFRSERLGVLDVAVRTSRVRGGRVHCARLPRHQ